MSTHRNWISQWLWSNRFGMMVWRKKRTILKLYFTLLYSINVNFAIMQWMINSINSIINFTFDLIIICLFFFLFEFYTPLWYMIHDTLLSIQIQIHIIFSKVIMTRLVSINSVVRVHHPPLFKIQKPDNS